MTIYSAVAVIATAYLLMFFLERLPRFRFRPLPLKRQYLSTDVAWYGVAIAMSAFSGFVLRPLLTKMTIRPTADAIARLPGPATYLLAFLIFDAMSYGIHRGLHRSERLWNIHKVHHSTLQLDGLAATRAHMMENMIRFMPPQLLMFVLGIPYQQITAALLTAAMAAIWAHSNLDGRFRFLERFMITPYLHRRHHITSTSNNNYGGVLNVWDRVFRSFVSVDTGADERFGVPGEIDTYPQRFADAVRKPIQQMREQRTISSAGDRVDAV